MAIVGIESKIINYIDDLYTDTGNRYRFAKVIEDNMSVGCGEGRCHYISIQYLKKSMAKLANQLQAGLIRQDEFDSDIDTLVAAVSAGVALSLSGREKAARDDIYEKVTEHQMKVKQGLRSQDFLKDLNYLLYYLNSVDKNLRPGNSKWNSSIGKYYDPDRWVYINQRGEEASSNKSLDIHGDEELQSWDFGQFERNAIHLISDVDRDKYSILAGLLKIKPPKLCSAKIKGTNTVIAFSSNNEFKFIEDSPYEQIKNVRFYFLN